jgi:hypothetical protein
MNDTALLLFFNSLVNASKAQSSTTDYDAFYMSEGWKIGQKETLSDPQLATDVAKAKDEAVKTGNQKLAATLDFILNYGDKALTILTKNGIIENKNLTASGYTFNVIPGTATDTTNKAPSASDRVFNIDWTDPKVLIICALLLGIMVYLFASISKEKKAKR